MKLILICSFLLTAFYAKSQDNKFKIADSLFKENKYFEAAIYAEKILFESENIEDKNLAVELKIECLKQQKKFKELNEFITDCYNYNPNELLRKKLVYEEILANYFTKNYLQTINLCNFLLPKKNSEKHLIDIVKIISYNQLQEWHIADSLWKIFTINMQIKDTLVNNYYSHLPKFKNEKKAATLSAFLPGTGQLYAGKPLEGLASFIFQAGSVWAGFAWWNRGYKLAAIALAGSFWTSFNDGGKRRAKKLVQQYNEKRAFDFNETLNKTILNTTKHYFKD